MLRVAVPYGALSAPQLRTLARIAREHDRGYGHFTTRQNLQYNWIPLTQGADVMDKLAAYLLEKETITGAEFMDILEKDDAEKQQ